MARPVRIDCEGERELGIYSCGGVAYGATEEQAKMNAYIAAGKDAIDQALKRVAPFCASENCALAYEVKLERGSVDGPPTRNIFKNDHGIIAQPWSWTFSGSATVKGVCRELAAAKKAKKKVPAKKLKIGPAANS